MSIYFNFEVGTAGRRFRRAVDGDKHDISSMVDHSYDKLFGTPDIGRFIELSTLSICMINAEMEVVGFLALDDHPNIPSVDPANWETWIRNMFQRYYISRNTLFVHYICCLDSVRDFFLDEAFMTVFENDLYLKQIVLMVPPHCSDDLILKHPVMKKKNVFKHYAKRHEEASDRYMFIFSRNEFCPKLKMRRAVEEDNDDIIEILDKTCPRLRDLYGDYYISELIGRHPESRRKIIVAEHQDRVVGVMCLNEEVNYKELASTYELRSYHGLRKATPMEKERAKRANNLMKTFGEPILAGKWSPFQHIDKFECFMDDQESDENVHVSGSKKNSKVNFGKHAMRKSLDHIIYRSQHQYQSDDYSEKIYPFSPSQSRNTVYSVTDLLDGDPFDYEIVNIDYELFTVPELPTHSITDEIPISKENKLLEIKKKGRSHSFVKNQYKTEDSNSFDYGGEPNGFIIELLGLKEGYSSRHMFDLLEAAFEVMKIYDYCIIRTPCEEPTFPLLEHFSYVPTKRAVCCKHALYIANRSSVFGKMRVKEAELVDVPHIANLLNNLEGKETLWTIENSIHDRGQHKAFVFLCGLTVVGVGILEPPEQMDFIRAKFNLGLFHNQKYHYYGQGYNAGFTTIKVIQAYSVFEPHFRFFARDMMRLSGYCTLLWLTAYRNKWESHKANALASAMIPLLPKTTEIDCTVTPELANFGNLCQKITAFSTWYIARKFTSMQKVDINTRIVVIGASRTAMSFLNSLLFTDASSYLNFTSVTLISPDGLPYTRHSKRAAEMMFPKYRTNTDKFLKSVPYTYYVNVVQGTMVDINRKNNHIVLRNGVKYYYDKLFLLLGRQYQHPDYLRSILERQRQNESGSLPPYVRLDIPRVEPEPRISTEGLPTNVFIVNTLALANKAINYVKTLFWDYMSTNKIIVYGASIHAYCCLAALLEANIPPESIIFVEPFPPESSNKIRVPEFFNSNVDQTIREVLDHENLTVYRSYYFQSWILDEFGMVTHVDFLSYFKVVRLQCAALFYYGKRGISASALDAVNRSGLVYDGGILIDHEFRTKDPRVYAAGSATRYHRRYYADTLRQKYFNSQEIGEKLGNQIRNELDPFFSKTKQNRNQSSVRFSTPNAMDGYVSPTSNHHEQLRKSMSESGEANNERLPVFKKPITTYCMLPGGLQYLEVRSPGLKQPNYYVQSLNFSGHVMETFKRGYFKIHLNSNNVVDGVTCLSTETYPLDNFQNIYGLPANVLNNVYLRYTANKLDDFYEFFRSPWALFLYHDQCDDLFAMAKELRPKGQRNGDTLGESLKIVRDHLSDLSLRFDTKLRVRSKFEHSAHMEAIADYVLEWLADNELMLPMYMHPGQLTYFQWDLTTNPAFRKKKTKIVKILKKIF